MKNSNTVNRALVAKKNFLLLNQSFGTVGSLNQTGETLTRENRIGLMSYLRRTLMLLLAILVMSMANVGTAWGASVAEGTYNFVDQTIGAATRFYKIDNGIYQYRLNAYTRNSSLGIQLPASGGDGTGFVFHLESTQKVYIGIVKKNVKREVTNNLYIKTITEANFSAIEAGSNNSTTVTLTLGGSATLSGDYTFAAIGTAKTEGATVYMGELPAGYYYAYGNSSNSEGNLYSITFGTQTLFLVPNDKAGNNAKFAIYYWMGASGYERQGWSDYMTVSPCNSSTYRADIPKGYTNLIFVRLAPSKGINWDSKWNQTGNLTFDGSKDLFTWANDSWDGATTTWSASTKYTISFAANGGSGSMSNVSGIACGRSVTIAANAYEKSGFTFTGWKANVDVKVGGETKTAGTLLADGVTIQDISSNITLTAQWEADAPACSAPTSPSISGTTSYTAGDNISLTASATGTSGSTTYTWYKGADWATASGTTPVQAESTSGATFTKNSCVAGDAGTYWCNISNGTGCDVQVNQAITVSAGCAASAPGNISKGEASGGSGTITLTSAGSPVSGDTWYWQASASGTSKSESGATKNVNAAGTYYIRSYNSSGDCWSAAKSVTVEAADLLTPISLSLSYDNPKLVLTALTTATPTLTGNAGGGTVSYVSGTTATATVNSLTGVVTAVAAGTTTITVNVTANGNYAAGSTTATIKVVAAPLGIVDQKLATGSVAWDASDIVTSDYTNITGLSAFAAQGGLSIDGGNGTTSSGTALTAKVEASGGTSKENSEYMEFHFTVASGKRLHVTAINAVVRSVSNDRVYYATLTGTTGSITKTTTVTEATSAGANIFEGQSYDEYFTGTVSFKLWAYSTSTQTKNLWYRIGSNIYITGTIEDDCTTPAAPTNFTAGSILATGATFTITDAADAASYDIYYSTESTAPTSGTAATTTSTSKTKEITGLTAVTTYYAWVRSVCDASNKSSWVALNPGGDTHTFTTTCLAPSSVEVAATAEAGNYGWRYTTGETMKLTATATGGSGGSYTYQWKKKTGPSSWKDLSDGADATDGGILSGTTSANLVISGLTSGNAGTYKCVVSTGSGCDTESNEFWVRVYTLNGNYSGSSFVENPIVWTDEFNGTTTITLNANSVYEFKVTDNDTHTFGLASPDIYKDENNFVIYGNDGNNVALHTGKATGTYTFTVNVYYANDKTNPYVTLTSVRYPKMRIYMSCGSTTWGEGSPVFFAHTYGGANNDVMMTAHECEAGLFYADVPSYNSKVTFTRQKPGSTEIAWNGDNFWNKSEDNLSIATNNLLTCTGWNTTPNPDEGLFTGSVYSPTTYTISFAANGGSGSMSAIGSIACGADQAITANSFEKTGYNFSCWHADVDVTVGGATVTAGSAIANSATIRNIHEDIALTAQWSPKEYTITLNGNGGTGNTGSVTATYNSATLSSSITNPSLDCYTFDGWYSGEGGTGALIINTSGVLQVSTTYTGAGGIWTNDDNVTLYAKWTKTPTALTVNLGGDAATPVGGSPIGTAYTLTCSASTGTIASYQWKQNTTASTTGAVNAEGTGATTASFNPVPEAEGTYYYYCVATDACENSVNTSFSGVFTFTAAVDPCSEPAEVTNEIARFFVPCGTGTIKYEVTNQDASTGDNTFTTYKVGSTDANNWYVDETSGFAYGKLTSSDSYIQLKLKSGSFQAGDVVTAYFNRNDGTKTGLKLKSTSGNGNEPPTTAAKVETSSTYTLVAADIEDDGSIKLFRANSSTYVNRIIVTRAPVGPSITATKTSPDYVTTDPNNLVLSISTTGASSGWYYRVKNTGTSGYQTPDNTTYTTTTWTMTSGLSLGVNNFVVELYNGSGVLQATSETITVTAETAYPITIAAGAGGSVSPSGEIKANQSGNHIHPTITATPSSGYRFVNWTLSNGNATLADASSATTTISNAVGACTITANFAAASLTAIEANTLYQAADMANITFTDSDQHFTGLSTNNHFKVYGTLGSTDAFGKNEEHSVTDDINTKNFTSALYITAADNTSSTSDPTKGAIEFITPSSNGTLYLYLNSSSSGLSIKKQGNSSSISLSGAVYKKIDVEANTHYFINGSGSARGLYGIKFIAAAASYTGLSVTKNPSAGSASEPTISATSVEQGSGVTVTAGAAADGYMFTGWTSENGTFASASSLETTFTPTANNAVATANYIAVKNIVIKILNEENKTGWVCQSYTTVPANHAPVITTDGDWIVITVTGVASITSPKFAYEAGGQWYYLDGQTITDNACYNWNGSSRSCDATAPTLVSSDPDNGDTDVNISGTIVLTFSEEIDNVDDSKFSLAGATIGTVEIDGSDATKVNIAYSSASYSSTVTLATAAGAVSDAAGNASAALSDISFTTEAAAGTTYYLVTSTSQLNTSDTYVIMEASGAAMMGTWSGSDNHSGYVTSGFTPALDKSTVTVTSSDVNTLTLQEESSAWNIVGKNDKKLSTNSTVSENLYCNTAKATSSSTDDFVFAFGDGKATIKRNGEASYKIYYVSGTGFKQSQSATNIRLYTSNSAVAVCSEAGLAYATSAVAKNVGDAAFTNTLTNPNSLSVTYSSGNTNVATVNGSGSVTIVAAGSTRITATWAGDPTYCAGSAYYDLTVSGDCTPQSISKVVLTSTSEGTVTGYNGGEFAGAAVIGGLNGSNTAEVDASHDGDETGYKLYDSNGVVFATLKSGTFRAGDQVKVTITKINDNYTFPSPISAKTGLSIFYGTNKSDATLLTTLSATDIGTYSYTLTAADVMAIGSKKGIGVCRTSTCTQNQYIYSVEIVGCREWSVCTAPDAVTAGSVTDDGATFTVTDALNTNNYEIYYSTSSTAPTAETSATVSGISTKSRAVTGLTAETTYYYWVRSNCGGVTKSSWVAGTPATFTTSAAAATKAVTYNGNGKTSGDVPTDATAYAEGDIVTVKGNTGSLEKTSSDFVGWNTESDGTGTFYPAGYKFYMPDAAVTLYAVWGTGRMCYKITDFETNNHSKSNDNKPDSHSKYLFGYMGTTDAAHALTLTSNNTNTKGQNSGVELRLDNSATLRIYANNVTNATPATFTGVTSVSFGAKLYNSSGSERTTSYTIKVGGTTVGSGSITGQASDGYFDITTGTFAAKNGYVEIIVGNGNSNNNLYIDDIEICTGSGSSGYTVTFDNNGEGSYSKTIENVPSGSKIGAPIPAPTAVGAAFGGWYREAGCTNAWNFGSNTISKDTTLYAKWTTCAPTISVHPSGATYTQNADASAMSVTASGDGISYQWYTSEDDGASIQGSSAIPGATNASYTPSTSLLGTIYYFCVVSNTCGNAVSSKAAITVNDSKPAPTAVWTIEEPKEGGKGFTFSIEVNENDGTTNWDGELIASMLTLSDNAILDGASIVVNNTNKTISGTYGVKAGSSSPVTFYLLLPATATQSATRLDEDRTFTPCAGGAGDSYKVRVRKDYEKDASNNYRWVTPGVGEITYAVGSSISSAKAASTVASDFDSIMSNDKQYVWVKTYESNTKTISLYVETSGANVSVNTLYKNTVYTTAADKDIVSSDDYSVSYDGSGSAENTGAKGTHYMDITFDSPLAANDIICVKFSSSKVRAYGAILTTVGDGGDQTTGLSWSNSQASGATVVKREDDPDFAITAVRNETALKSLGLISYTSSNTAIATIDGATGLVHIADNIDFGSDEFKTTTITATLAASGCYKKAVITYILKVTKYVCEDTPGTITYVDNGCSGMVLTLEGYEEGAAIQWYKDGVSLGSADGAQTATYTATTAGEYYAISHKTCDITSTNSITVEFASATAEKIVDQWYVKNGRRTPDIALVQTEGATSFTVTSSGSPITAIGGCTFELKSDGIIYLHGTKENGDAPSDMTPGDMTITITVSGCSGALSGLDITLHIQAETAKPSVAFLVDGTTRAKGGTATSVSADKTSNRDLWTYLNNTFALTGCNVYWSVDSKELREYYSQFDAILITDDPNTQTKGTGGVPYVKAFGTMVDVRPILTLEAYVGRYSDGGWHVYNADPSSPNPRQVEMKLECKNHDIFKGLDPASSDNVRVTTDAYDNEYWHVIMVDTTVAPYHNTSKDYKDLPALQGFDKTKFDHMLGVGTIFNEKLQAGVERQEEPAARMMILGIQNEAMAALTNEGKLIVKNAIEYLLKTNMEDVNDCSNYFTDDTGDHLWSTAANWSRNEVPDFETRARILRPVVLPNNVATHVARVDIATGGKSKWIDGETCTGNLTIAEQGALIITGQLSSAHAPYFGLDDLMPTEAKDVFINSTADGNGTLIMNNESGEDKATVAMYSKAQNSGGNTTWQYIGVPHSDITNAQSNYYNSWLYQWDPSDGWLAVPNMGSVSPWTGYCITHPEAGHTYYMEGTLAATGTVEIDVPANSFQVIGNSWTAPIQIQNFDDDDFGDITHTIYFFNTGLDVNGTGSTAEQPTGDARWAPGTYVSIPIHSSPYTGDSIISSLQGFYVANTGAAGTLHLDYDKIVRPGIGETVKSGPMHAPSRVAATSGKPVVAKLWVSGSRYDDRLVVLEREDFTRSNDDGWDGEKWDGSTVAPCIWSENEDGGVEAVTATPDFEGTTIGFRAGEDDTYSFSFEYDGMEDELYLLDIETQLYTRVLTGNTYLFTCADKGEHNRFLLTRNAPGIATGTDKTENASGERAKKFIYENKMYIFIRGVLYDATGKRVTERRAE